MATLSKARAEGLTKRVVVDIQADALERLESIAALLGITRAEMTKRLISAASTIPLSNEIWQEAKKERPRKVFLRPRRHPSQPPTQPATT